MESFITRAVAAIWKAYAACTERISTENISERIRIVDTRSWLYDAACLLEIVLHDEAMLEKFEWYYKNYMELPWNKPGGIPGL
jgi:hypothetical protein